MKIAIVMYEIADLGGIINHTEQLALGFKELGNEVDFLQMVYGHNAQEQRKTLTLPEACGTGFEFDQRKGWNLPAENRIPYKGTVNLEAAKRKLEEYDLVIWTTPVPPKNKPNRGNTDWPLLYDTNVPQIAIIHDGNALQSYPHIAVVEHHFVGLACVHPCALNTASFVQARRDLILNPQAPADWDYINPWEGRSGFLSMQTFKAWKHVDDLVRAIAYMKPAKKAERRMVAGAGIEYQYMTSEKKCKPKYFHNDPTMPFHEERIWDAALANGMERPPNGDYLTNTEADKLLTEVKLLIDPSWSRRYTQNGGHFNRVTVDAIRRGAIPMGTIMGNGAEVLKPGVHYVPLDQKSGPADYALQIEAALSMPVKQAETMQQNGREIYKQFERKNVAQMFLNLVSTRSYLPIGMRTGQSITNAKNVCYNHFGFEWDHTDESNNSTQRPPSPAGRGALHGQRRRAAG